MGEDRQARADALWNRACDATASGLPPDARTGDVMVLRAIAFDGEVHNSGLLARVQDGSGVDEALEALRWFGLVDAAERVERIRDEWRRLSADGGPLEEAVDALEAEADRMWFEMPEGDLTDQLTAALLARLDDDPAVFSPI